MKNFPTQFIATLVLLTLFNTAHSQEADAVKDKIATTISQYFDLDRESIHAHFDKNTFFSNEAIWFKGYVFNKKNNTPFFETTNVFAVLYNNEGKQLQEQLVFSYNGTFTGSFKLDNTFTSGRYYVHFYTNWMNNFSEDESTATRYSFNVINETERLSIDYDAPNYSKINIAFQPEGGNFIEGTSNNVGIRISDCNGNPVAVKEGQIINAAGEVVGNFLVNKSGYGKVYITPTNETLKAVFNIDNKKVEAPLPKPEQNGIALEVNNYALPDKTIIKLRTNARTAASLSGKSLYVVVQQNDKSNIFDVSFNNQNPEKELVITNDNLFKGANIIRILDSKMTQLAERAVFEMPDYKSGLSLSVIRRANDSIKVAGNIIFPNANISISVFPENALSNNKRADLFGAALINPYLKEPISNAAYYLNEPSKAKRYELDLFLLNQKTLKYDWRDIQSQLPKTNYEFDIGLSVKGTINQSLPDRKKYRIQLLSIPLLINDYSEINEKNEFYFKNLVISDSSNVKFTLMKIPSVPVDLKLYQQVLNRKRTFNKPFVPKPVFCEAVPQKLTFDDMPQFADNVVLLDNVDITGQSKREKLKYRNMYGNANLRGYKVKDDEYAIDLLSFINSNGFEAGLSMGEVYINGRVRTTINAQRSSPEVYINGRQLFNLDELQDIRMSEVDEIYLNPHAIVASIKGNMGVIKIYLKQLGYGDPNTQTKTAMITEGFAKIRNFENSLYMSTSTKGFESYGIIHWIPTILTDQDGNFKFQVADPTLKSIKVVIEGFTSDGKLISETRTINLK